MKRKPLIALLLLGGIVALTVFFMGEAVKPKPLIAASDDGMAQLSIPDGALPEGVAPESVTIRAVPAKDLFADGQAHVVYKLEPDGTVLNAPAQVRLSLPAPAPGEPLALPVLLHYSTGPDGEPLVEAPEEVTVEYDEATKTMRYTASIGHFSSFSAETDANLFTITAAPQTGTFSVGDTINRTLTVTPKTYSYTNKHLPWGENREARATYLDVTLSVGNGTRWQLVNHNGSEMIVFNSTALTPASQPLVEKDIGATQAYTHAYPFTCAKEGDGTVIDRGAFAIIYTLQIESKYRHEKRQDVRRESRYHVASVPSSMNGDYTCSDKPLMQRVGPPILCDPTGKNKLLVPCP